MSIALPTGNSQMLSVEGGHVSDKEVIRGATRSLQDSEQRRLHRLAIVQAKVEAADVDPLPSLIEAEMDRHFERRLAM